MSDFKKVAVIYTVGFLSGTLFGVISTNLMNGV